jgi:ribA/ribD-fused uncharacterized protein
MESVALFEEKVPITPRDLSRDKIQIEALLRKKLATKLEGKCSLHGWVQPNSIQLLSRSMGYVEKGRFTGDIVYHVQAEGKVYNPPAGLIVEGDVIRKNNMGMYVNYKDAVHIILPRDLHIGDEAFDRIAVGDTVQVEIKKSKFQVNDEFILSVGLFRGRPGQVNRPIEPSKTVSPIDEQEDLAKEVEEARQAAAAAATAEEDEEELEVEEIEETTTPIPATVTAAPATAAAATAAPAAPTTAATAAAAIEEPLKFYSDSKDKFAVFSNLYEPPTPIYIDGKAWPTVEHYFQAMKFPSDPAYQEQIRLAVSPKKDRDRMASGKMAKKMGASREHPIRQDWNTYRLEVMKKALREKFTQDDDLYKLLIEETGDRILQENSPSDSFWGLGRNGKGQNQMGRLLQQLRQELRQEATGAE